MRCVLRHQRIIIIYPPHRPAARIWISRFTSYSFIQQRMIECSGKADFCSLFLFPSPAESYRQYLEMNQ